MAQTPCSNRVAPCPPPLLPPSTVGFSPFPSPHQHLTTSPSTYNTTSPSPFPRHHRYAPVPLTQALVPPSPPPISTAMLPFPPRRPGTLSGVPFSDRKLASCLPSSRSPTCAGDLAAGPVVGCAAPVWTATGFPPLLKPYNTTGLQSLPGFAVAFVFYWTLSVIDPRACRCHAISGKCTGRVSEGRHWPVEAWIPS